MTGVTKRSEFPVPELASIGLEVEPHVLNRGVLITGASGAGKTKSALEPILKSVRSEWQAAIVRDALLVIDPKHELIAADDPDVVRVGTAGSLRVCFYDETIDRTDAGVLLDEALALIPAATPFARDPFWRASARALLRACLQIDVTIFNEASSAEAALLRQKLVWRALARQLSKGSTPVASTMESLTNLQAPWSRYLLLCRLLQRGQAGPLPDRSMSELTRVLLAHLPSYDPAELLSVAELPNDTGASVVATCAAILGPITDSAVQERISFDPNPWVTRPGSFAMSEAIRSGQCLVYQPRDVSEENATIGKAIKRAYLRAVIRGATRDQSGQLERRAYYIADEFHRFVGGEEVYFDVMRASGGCAIVATQSLGALTTALGEGKESLVQTLTSNLSTRVQFMSPEPSTIRDWQVMLPPPSVPSLPHVLTARPISMLRAGEAYWFSEGRFGFGRILRDCA